MGRDCGKGGTIPERIALIQITCEGTRPRLLCDLDELMTSGMATEGEVSGGQAEGIRVQLGDAMPMLALVCLAVMC